MMWVPEYLRMRHPAFGKAYDIPETDKQSILGKIEVQIKYLENKHVQLILLIT